MALESFSPSVLDQERGMPLVLVPKDPKLVLESALMAVADALRDALHRHGAILFRGFDISTPERFKSAVRALSSEFPPFEGESSPRSQISDFVYSSTDYRSDYPIQFHNEYSYGHEWPLRLYFCCLLPSASGGETPISNSRRVLSRLRPQTAERFRRRGVKYVRNFVPYMGVSWQKAFRTESRETAEALCRRVGMEYSWLDEECLRTWHVADAIVRHPVTKEECWFNHAFFFNVGSLEPAALRDAMRMQPEDELSTQTYYGDGESIETEVIEEIRNAHASERVAFRWERGDVLLIDNMLTAHSRGPFSGERRIAVAMAERCERSKLIREGGGDKT